MNYFGLRTIIEGLLGLVLLEYVFVEFQSPFGQLVWCPHLAVLFSFEMAVFGRLSFWSTFLVGGERRVRDILWRGSVCWKRQELRVT